MKQGDVVLVHYPFTDTSGSKLRPAIVVSGDAFNAGEDLILVPISSAPEPAADPFTMPIRETDPDFAQTGLKRTSSVKWTKLLALSRRLITRRLGIIPDPRLEHLRSSIRRIFE